MWAFRLLDPEAAVTYAAPPFCSSAPGAYGKDRPASGYQTLSVLLCGNLTGTQLYDQKKRGQIDLRDGRILLLIRSPLSGPDFVSWWAVSAEPGSKERLSGFPARCKCKGGGT